MELSTLLILLLVLACPLLMVFMHRGGHASETAHRHGDRAHGSGAPLATGSLDELRHLRAELDAEIVERERAEAGAEPTAAA